MTETGGSTLAAIRILVGLLAAAALAGVAIRWLRIPYSVALVAIGLAAGVLLPSGAIEVTPELVLLVLLPGLVFEAALRLHAEDLRRTLGWMVLLAAPGVLVSAAVVAIVLNLATGLPLDLGMVVGAMVAATDPVAVIATFRDLGVPRRLATLVEGESLFNDATALVLFATTVALIGGEVGLAEAASDLVITIVSSIALGLVAGWLSVRLIALTAEHVIELTISAAAAYGTYLLAEELHQSGIIATVVAGVVIGTLGRTSGLSARALGALDIVWELVAFLLTAFAFLMVGIAISAGDLVAAAPWILWGLVGVVVGRALVVYGLLGGTARLLARRDPGSAVSTGWLHVLFWAGLRGAVAVAMALSLPAEFPQREILQQITFGIVLFTLVVQGASAGRVVSRAGVRTEGA
jgi:monovalent cation:H+ antiporter, CPA1 family